MTHETAVLTIVSQWYIILVNIIKFSYISMNTPTHTAAEPLQTLFDQSIQAFPYPALELTSIVQGTLETGPDEEVEYSAEYTFPVGKLLDENLIAGGWIDLRRDEGEVSISAFFGAARTRRMSVYGRE